MSGPPATAMLRFLLIGDGSLIVVQMRRNLKASLTSDLTSAGICGFPIVTGLAQHAADQGAANAQLGLVADRAPTWCNALAVRSRRRAG
jgi:hypothetical protein